MRGVGGDVVPDAGVGQSGLGGREGGKISGGWGEKDGLRACVGGNAGGWVNLRGRCFGTF